MSSSAGKRRKRKEPEEGRAEEEEKPKIEPRMTRNRAAKVPKRETEVAAERKPKVATKRALPAPSSSSSSSSDDPPEEGVSDTPPIAGSSRREEENGNDETTRETYQDNGSVSSNDDAISLDANEENVEGEAADSSQTRNAGSESEVEEASNDEGDRQESSDETTNEEEEEEAADGTELSKAKQRRLARRAKERAKRRKTKIEKQLPNLEALVDHWKRNKRCCRCGSEIHATAFCTLTKRGGEELTQQEVAAVAADLNLVPAPAPTPKKKKKRRRRKRFKTQYPELPPDSTTYVVLTKDQGHITEATFTEIFDAFLKRYVDIDHEKGEWAPTFNAWSYSKSMATINVTGEETRTYMERCLSEMNLVIKDMESHKRERPPLTVLSGHVQFFHVALRKHLDTLIKRMVAKYEIPGICEGVSVIPTVTNGAIIRIKVCKAALKRIRELRHLITLSAVGRTIFCEKYNRRGKKIIYKERNEDSSDSDVAPEPTAEVERMGIAPTS